MKKILSLLTVVVLVFSLLAFTAVGASAAGTTAGDVNADNVVDSDDAVYLLYNVLFGDEEYPIAIECDYNGDDAVTAADAVYLMNHVLFGEEEYPLGDVNGDVDMGNKDEGFGEWVPIG